jgi:hypothetical protein
VADARADIRLYLVVHQSLRVTSTGSSTARSGRR